MTGTMLTTTVIAFFVMRNVWHWPLWRAAVLTLAFLSIDLTFLSANLLKVAAGGWLLIPVAMERASYGPFLFLLGVAVGSALAWLLVRRLYHGRLRRSPAWDCGFPWQTARMQDTAEGFGQPIRQIFEPFFRMERVLPSPFDAKPRYRVTIGDHFWHWIYLPIAAGVERLSRWIGVLQQGRIAVYLTYSFLTLIAVLLWVMR